MLLLKRNVATLEAWTTHTQNIVKQLLKPSLNTRTVNFWTYITYSKYSPRCVAIHFIILLLFSTVHLTAQMAKLFSQVLAITGCGSHSRMSLFLASVLFCKEYTASRQHSFRISSKWNIKLNFLSDPLGFFRLVCWHKQDSVAHRWNIRSVFSA